MNKVALRKELNKRLKIAKIELSKKSFWDFCKLLQPDFYNEKHLYLKDYCDTLEKFYRRELLKKDGSPYLRLIIQMPPQTGKTRTLVLWEMWVLGQNINEMIITCAYNDDTAIEFSKYVRDGIQEIRNTEEQIVFKDIFPNTKIKKFNASAKTWALQGRHFTYRGAGIGGSITSKGGTIKVIDDPIKSAEDAFNDNYLEKLWRWYTGTFMSRNAPGESPLEILNHTPWVSGDLQSRLLNSEESEEWYIFKVESCKDGKMFCEDILSFKQYKRFEKYMDPFIFQANYNMQIMDANVLLYGNEFKTYRELPVTLDEVVRKKCSDYELRSWADTADTGDDYFCQVFCLTYKGYAYVLDIMYTDENVEKTEPEAARKTIQYKIEIAKYEGNSGGHAIATHIKRILEKDYKWFSTIFETYAQTENKQTRILTNMKQVKERIIFPDDWKFKFPKFYQDITTYKRKGKNLHDDGPDVLTKIVEDIAGPERFVFFNDDNDNEDAE